jgi:signal peptidase II
MNKKISLLISFGIIVLLIGIDQLTKWLCNTNETLLSGDRIMVIEHFVSLRLAYNKGAAWSILEGKKFILVSISLLASIVVGVMLVKLVDFKNNKLLSSALILLTVNISFEYFLSVL